MADLGIQEERKIAIDKENKRSRDMKKEKKERERNVTSVEGEKFGVRVLPLFSIKIC